MTIMIVEDNLYMREMIKKIIIQGFEGLIEFSEFSNGIESVEQYEHSQPDVVLMDIALKGMDGFCASKCIKKIDPNAKIIVVSQYDEDEFKEYAEELGISAYISKDQLNDIIRAIEESLNISYSSKKEGDQVNKNDRIF